MDLLLTQIMVHYLSRVQMNHLLISAKQKSINFDFVFTGTLQDLVAVGLVRNSNLAGS